VRERVARLARLTASLRASVSPPAGAGGDSQPGGRVARVNCGIPEGGFMQQNRTSLCVRHENAPSEVTLSCQRAAAGLAGLLAAIGVGTPALAALGVSLPGSLRRCPLEHRRSSFCRNRESARSRDGTSPAVTPPSPRSRFRGDAGQEHPV